MPAVAMRPLGDRLGWRGSRLLVAVLIGLFFTIQLAIPIDRLDSDQAMRFGWQMFSFAHPTPEFSVRTTEGESNVEIDDYVASSRVDVDLIRWLPPHMCAVVDGAIEIKWDEGSLKC